MSHLENKIMKELILPSIPNALYSLMSLNTVPMYMVATGQPVLCVATFAELATRALKHTKYSNFGTCRPTGPEIWAQIQCYAWQLVGHYTLHPLI